MRWLNIFLVFFLALAVSVNGQNSLSESGSEQIDEDFFELQLTVDSDILTHEIAIYRDEVHQFIESIKRRHRASSKARLIEDMFYRGHNKFLRHYAELTTFGDLLSNGKYDCLTATIFYSYCLDALEIDHTIVETPNHIFLLVKNEGILLETTDPINGFVQGEYASEERLAEAYEDMDIREEVDFRQTIGLQHYNAAVEDFNNKEYLSSVEHVVKSSRYYSGPRLVKIGLILSRAISNSDFNEDVKFTALLKLTRTFDNSIQMVGVH
jgi:hypothetical protein